VTDWTVADAVPGANTAINIAASTLRTPAFAPTAPR
jgi:hypothetical protein